MAAVSGSKQIKMVVVEHRPKRDILVRCSIFLCIIFVGIGFYLFGFARGVALNGDARQERDILQADLSDSSVRVVRLRQEVVNQEQAIAVDKQTLAEVQGIILGLREINAQLEEDVLFYKQIMSPENDESGLVIGQVDLLITEDDNRIHYRIEFKQMASNDNVINGHTNISILGVQGGEEKSLPLHSLSLTEDELDISLNFRYFQNIEGELVLPDNFVPDKVQIEAVVEGRNGKTVRKSFGWLTEV